MKNMVTTKKAISLTGIAFLSLIFLAPALYASNNPEPAPLSIKINNGASITNTAGVTLSLSLNSAQPVLPSLKTANGISPVSPAPVKMSLAPKSAQQPQVRFCNEDMVWSVPQAFSSVKNWVLTSGDGQKTVYAEYRPTPSSCWSNPCLATIILDTMVAHYSFAVDFNDSSRSANNGTPHWDVDFDFSPNGNYFAGFKGQGGYIEAKKPYLNTGAMTISFWVKPDYEDYAGKRYAIVSAGNDYYIEITGDAKGFRVGPGGIMGDASLSAPTNLLAEPGGMGQGKYVVYLSWDLNSLNEDGITVGITKQFTGSTGESLTNLPAHTRSYKAFIDPGVNTHDIRVYVTKQDGSRSESAKTQLKLDGQDPDPSDNFVTEWLPRDNKWHYVAQTHDPYGTIRYYVDGQLVYTGASWIPAPAPSLNFKSRGPIQGTSSLLIGTANLPKQVQNIFVNTDSGPAIITWDTIAGQKYRVQYKDNQPQSTDWVDLQDGPILADSASLTVTDYQYIDQRIYRVLQMDAQTYRGGLDEVRIYNSFFSDADIQKAYLDQRRYFRQIDNTFVSVEAFQNLSEPEYSVAMDELEAFSKKYAAVWRIDAIPATSAADAMPYLAQRWERQRQFYINQLRIMEKYNLLDGRSADDIIAQYTPLWNTQRQNMAWSQNAASNPGLKDFFPRELKAQPKVQAARQIKAVLPWEQENNKQFKAEAFKPQPPPAQGGQAPRPMGGGDDIEPSCGGLRCQCHPTNAFAVYSPYIPLLYTNNYQPDVFQFSAQEKFFTFQVGGVFSDDGGCLNIADHKMEEITLNNKVEEQVRTGLLFEGEVFKLEKEITLKYTEHLATKTNDDWTWGNPLGYPESYNSKFLPNQLGLDPPPRLNRISDVAHYNESYLDINYDTYFNRVSTQLLKQVRLTRGLQFSDIDTDNLTYGKIAFMIDYYLKDQPDWQLQVAKTAAYAAWPFLRHPIIDRSITWSAIPDVDKILGLRIGLNGRVNLDWSYEYSTKRFCVEFNLSH